MPQCKRGLDFVRHADGAESLPSLPGLSSETNFTHSRWVSFNRSIKLCTTWKTELYNGRRFQGVQRQEKPLSRNWWSSQLGAPIRALTGAGSRTRAHQSVASPSMVAYEVERYLSILAWAPPGGARPCGRYSVGRDHNFPLCGPALGLYQVIGSTASAPRHSAADIRNDTDIFVRICADGQRAMQFCIIRRPP